MEKIAAVSEAAKEKVSAKKPAAKKAATAKKPAAKKAAAVDVVLQFNGMDIKLADVQARALDAVRAAGCAAASVDVYLKPEDGVAYWVGHGKDGDASGSVPLQA